MMIYGGLCGVAAFATEHLVFKFKVSLVAR